MKIDLTAATASAALVALHTLALEAERDGFIDNPWRRVYDALYAAVESDLLARMAAEPDDRNPTNPKHH